MCNRTVLVAALIALYGVTLPAAADIKPNEEAASRAAAQANKNQSVNDTSKLRCWQYGELLFEESGISNKTLSKDFGSIAFTRGGDKQGQLLLVDFGTATCLYEE